MSKRSLTSQGVRDLNTIGKKPPKKACSHPVSDIYVHAVKEDRDRGCINVLACDHCNEIIGAETDFDVILPPLT